MFHQTNIANYVIVALVVFIISLCGTIYFNRLHITELQEQVNQSDSALKMQNTMIEQNRMKNEQLNNELQTYIEKVKKDFSKIKTPDAYHKEAQNECEAFIGDLAEAYQSK